MDTLETIRTSTIKGAFECLNSYCEHAQSIDYMMRSYFCAMMPQKEYFIEQLLAMKPYNSEDNYFLEAFISVFKVHLLIIRQKEGIILKPSPEKNDSALLCLFVDVNDQYYIAYHQKHRHIDTTFCPPLEGALTFPLIYSPTKPEFLNIFFAKIPPVLRPPQDVSKAPPLAPLIQELAKFILDKGNNEWGALKRLLTEAASEEPSLNSGYVQELFQILSGY